ncbi:hypothetical protein D3C71_2135770 [compost metagenome]
MSMASLSVVSEIAMVPDSECRMPTLIVSSAAKAPLNAVVDRTVARNAPVTRALIFI